MATPIVPHGDGRDTPNTTPAIAIVKGLTKDMPKPFPSGLIYQDGDPCYTTTTERYYGAMEDLVAAGFVATEQFIDGGSSWSQGRRVHRNCRKDETYRRIIQTSRAGLWRVEVGLPREEARRRKDAEAATYRKEREEKDAAERAKELSQAEYRFRAIPKTERQFRFDTIDSLRSMVRIALEGALEGRDSHGYTIASDAADGIYLSFDAMAEAILQAEVKCDHAKQSRIVADLQSRIVAAGGGAAAKVAALVRPNPSVLQGEAS